MPFYIQIMRLKILGMTKILIKPGTRGDYLQWGQGRRQRQIWSPRGRGDVPV